MIVEKHKSCISGSNALMIEVKREKEKTDKYKRLQREKISPKYMLNSKL